MHRFYLSRYMMKGWVMSIVLALMCLLPIGYVSAFGIEDTVEFPYDDVENGDDGATATDVGQVIKDASISDEEGVVQRIMNAFGINYFQDEGTEQTATFYVKEVINRILAIMGLVALIVVLFGFYKMFIAKDNEEGLQNARKIVLNAVLAIVIIGVSWFLVSWFFAIYEATLGTTTN